MQEHYKDAEGDLRASASCTSSAFSRWREVLADRYALDATRNGPAFASAMTRLANQNLAEVDPEPWVEWLLYSHPALEKRIKMAREYVP